jgi:hypothetical protein
MPNIPMSVRTPEALKAARLALGLSADGLARMLRVDDGRTVRRWEADGPIPGPVTVVMETAMGYLSKRAMIATQLEMLRSGKMRTGSSEGRAMVDDTSSTIAHLETADADYEAALNILKSMDGSLGTELEALTLQPASSETGREVHWYHLWRQTPKHTPPEKDDWSVPSEVSADAALDYFEKHEGFSGGLSLCDDPDDLSAEFTLEKRKVIRTPRGKSMSLRAGELVESFAVRSGPRRRRRAPQIGVATEDAQPFPTIRLNRLAPGSQGGFLRLQSLRSAMAYVDANVPNKQRSEFWWLAAIAALNNSAATGAQFGHARAALAEALRCEGWLGDE